MLNTLDNNFKFLDILTILSFIIGIQNLELNKQQVNSLDAHLKEQDSILINEQNGMLKTIIEQNKEIIKLLKEINNA